MPFNQSGSSATFINTYNDVAGITNYYDRDTVNTINAYQANVGKRILHPPQPLESSTREEATIIDTPDYTTTPPPEDRQPPIPGAAVLDKAREWTTHIHPDGWTYHFRACKYQADVEFHEIRGALEDPIHGEDIDALQAASKYSLRVQLSNRPAVVEFGGLRVETYIDHSRCYASKDKELVISTFHTLQDGGYNHICSDLTRC